MIIVGLIRMKGRKIIKEPINADRIGKFILWKKGNQIFSRQE